MNRIKRNKQGFTLIELIVVIAILAILAGIAIPVYSGYASKANEAADLQLLGAVNTAFSAACLSHGVDPRHVNASAELDGGHLSITSDGLDNDFLRFFGENVNTPFKVFTSLAYDKANGVFVNGDQTKTIQSGGVPVSATIGQLAAFQNSAFGEMGFPMLSADIGTAAGAVAYDIGNGQDLMDNKDTDPVASDLYTFLTSLGLSDPEIEDLEANEVANAMILYTASSTDPDVDSSINQLTLQLANTGNPTTDLAVNTLLAYFLAEGYVNSEYATEAQKEAFDDIKNASVTDVWSALKSVLMRSGGNGAETLDSNVSGYLNSSGKADIKGYLSAMGVIGENTSSLSPTQLREFLNSGFSTENEFYQSLSELLSN